MLESSGWVVVVMMHMCRQSCLHFAGCLVGNVLMPCCMAMGAQCRKPAGGKVVDGNMWF